jgi:hypothetical protein
MQKIKVLELMVFLKHFLAVKWQVKEQIGKQIIKHKLDED